MNSIEKTPSESKTVFIVEDNNIYARLLQVVIQTRFPEIKEVEIFPIGELCLAELDRNPSIVIIDYFLNTQYTEEDEKHNGLAIIKRIRTKKPETNIIVLSGQKDIHVALEANEKYGCCYVQKGPDAFNRVEANIKAIFNHTALPVFESLV